MTGRTRRDAVYASALPVWPDLDARIAAAADAYRACRLCPRDCGVDRTQGPRGAFCRLGTEAFVYKELLSVGEEAAVSPTMLVDLGGCSLRCLFCSEWEHVVAPRRSPAVPLDPAWLARQMRRRRQQGARSVTFVGGEPIVNLLAVLRALAAVAPGDRLPVVWNTNGQASAAALALLGGVVTTWNVDLKFGNPRCAERLAGVHGFDAQAEVARVLAFALRDGAVDPATGLPRAIVRHLVMPGHGACCTRPALAWLADTFPGACLNLMTGYLPLGPAAGGHLRAAELGRRASAREVAEAVDTAAAAWRRAVWIDGVPRA
ncbi:MAG: radical SAM protein [Myxococcales bacterium]|nr:radical SAM protein [Myxococcales bacterium]